MTLKPGDVIFTGTPSGVILGYPEAEQRWLKSGDKIVISIEKLGTLVKYWSSPVMFLAIYNLKVVIFAAVFDTAFFYTKLGYPSMTCSSLGY